MKNFQVTSQLLNFVNSLFHGYVLHLLVTYKSTVSTIYVIIQINSFFFTFHYIIVIWKLTENSLKCQRSGLTHQAILTRQERWGGREGGVRMTLLEH